MATQQSKHYVADDGTQWNQCSAWSRRIVVRRTRITSHANGRKKNITVGPESGQRHAGLPDWRCGTLCTVHHHHVLCTPLNECSRYH